MRHKSVLRNSARRRPATISGLFCRLVRKQQQQQSAVSSQPSWRGYYQTAIAILRHYVCSRMHQAQNQWLPVHTHTHTTFHFAHDRWNAHPFTTANLPAQRTAINRCKIQYVRHTNLNPDHVASVWVKCCSVSIRCQKYLGNYIRTILEGTGCVNLYICTFSYRPPGCIICHLETQNQSLMNETFSSHR
jgi:hypothetical protein